MRYLNVLTVLLLILELSGILNIGWLLVFTPTLIWFGIVILLLVSAVLLAVIAAKQNNYR